MDNEGRELFQEIRDHLDRQATAAEKLVEIAEHEQVQFDKGPTLCPACGAFNPVVTQVGSRGDESGPIDGFVLVAEMHCCNKQMYCVPDGWALTTSREEAVAYVNERKGGR